MNRILTFHSKDSVGNDSRLGPTYYIEADYEPVAVRIYAETAPLRDAKFDVFDDGVSIFNNRTPKDFELNTGKNITGAVVTATVLSENQNSEEYAEDFTNTPIEEGSWVYCDLVDSGGGKNFTVHLEMKEISEKGEYEE